MANIKMKLGSNVTFSVLLDKLEGLDESEGLVDASSDWQVVDRHLPQVALAIDDEETP